MHSFYRIDFSVFIFISREGVSLEANEAIRHSVILAYIYTDASIIMEIRLIYKLIGYFRQVCIRYRAVVGGVVIPPNKHRRELASIPCAIVLSYRDFHCRHFNAIATRPLVVVKIDTIRIDDLIIGAHIQNQYRIVPHTRIPLIRLTESLLGIIDISSSLHADCIVTA
jgi:hypothetical protein